MTREVTTLSDMFDEPEGAKPLEPDDARGLIPTWVATRGDLNTAEQANIAKAIEWAASKGGPSTLSSLLTEKTLRNLHKHMFGDVWKWAGAYRQHNTNMGDDWPYIPVRVHDLLADVLTQTADPVRLPWSADELAIRFHHRLMVIHPFVSGNGRHSRLTADLLVEALGQTSFTWGSRDLGLPGSCRSTYLEALRRADTSDDFEALVRFARG